MALFSSVWENILFSFNKMCFCCCQTEYSLSVKSIILMDSVFRSNTPLLIFCLHDLSINERSAKAVTPSKECLSSLQLLFFFSFVSCVDSLLFSKYNCRILKSSKTIYPLSPKCCLFLILHFFLF